MNAPIDISQTVLTTKRLTLRPWKISDLDDFFEYASVDGVGQMAGWCPHRNKAETQKILNSFIQHKKTFALEHHGKVIGSLGVEKYNEANLPELSEKQGREIGYVLSKAYWGQGLMPEAVNRVVQYLFEDVKLDFVTCSYFLSNPQSKRVTEKCGFSSLRLINYKTTFDTEEKTMLTIRYR